MIHKQVVEGPQTHTHTQMHYRGEGRLAIAINAEINVNLNSDFHALITQASNYSFPYPTGVAIHRDDNPRRRRLDSTWRHPRMPGPGELVAGIFPGRGRPALAAFATLSKWSRQTERETATV